MWARLWSFLTPRAAGGQSRPAPAAPKPSGLPVHAFGERSDFARLARVLQAAGFADGVAWAGFLAEPMRNRGITGPRRVAAFLATIGHESAGGNWMVENLSYSADAICRTWPERFPTPESAAPLARNPSALAEAVYGGRMGNGPPASGDGWRFRGRGLIQITGRATYGAAAEAVGLPLVAEPDMAAERAVAAHIAAWWWAMHGCNELADKGEVEAWRKRVNGGLTGLLDVRRRYQAVLAELGAEVLGA
jgi:putative chitinase